MKRVYFIYALQQAEDGELKAAYIMDEQHPERIKAFSSNDNAVRWLDVNTNPSPTNIFEVRRAYIKPE
jgi:hypothetical protein